MGVTPQMGLSFVVPHVRCIFCLRGLSGDTPILSIVASCIVTSLLISLQVLASKVLKCYSLCILRIIFFFLIIKYMSDQGISGKVM